jgi:hypothetical protein
MKGQDRVALAGLLSRALIDQARAFARAGPAGGEVRTGGVPNLVLWSNFLRLFDDDRPVSRRDLPRLARLSTRAMKSIVVRLDWIGWVTVEPDPGRPRYWVVRLAGPGRTVRDAWRPLAAEADARGRERLGDERVRRLRAALERLVGRFDLELPHYPTGYGAADASMTGAAWSPDPPRRTPSGIPHGVDWPRVRRGEGDTVSELSLSALLSQALVGFAIDYERHGLGPMELVTNVLQPIGDRGVALGAAPGNGLVVGDGRSVLERHLIVAVDPHGTGTGEERLVRLTPRGRQWRDAYRPLVAEIEADWENRFGPDVVADLRHALEAVDRDLDPALPHFPVVRFELGLGFTDVSVGSEQPRL